MVQLESYKTASCGSSMKMGKHGCCSAFLFVFSVVLFSLTSAHAVAAADSVLTQGVKLGKDISDIFCPQRPPLGKYLDQALNETDFSMEKMYVFASLARQAYNAPAAERNLRNEGFDEIKLISNDQTSFSAFLARRGSHAILAISGTFGIQDALQDLKFATVPDSKKLMPGRLHQGFEEAIDSVWPLTLGILSQGSFAGVTIHVAGHSLGAATGILAAARLAASGFNVAGVYAFASPRVGNYVFANWYDNLLGDRTYRFIRGVDVVPRVPPDSSDSVEFASLFPEWRADELRRLFERFGYKHVGKLFEFERNADATTPEWPSGTDMGYWIWLRRQFASANPLLSLLSSRDAALHHIPDAFVCYPLQRMK